MIKPTEKMIEAATKVYIGNADITEAEARPEVIRILSAALAVEAGTTLDVDALAQEIRRVDGDMPLNHRKLAEALMPFLSALTTSPASSGVEGEAAPVKASFVCGLKPGEIFVAHPEFPPHVWDGTQMVRLGPDGRTAAAPPAGWKLVPESAIAWLFGEGPDTNGNWFERPKDAVGAYWWRSRFRKLISAPSLSAGAGGEE